MSSAVTGKGVPVKVPSRSNRLSVLRLVRMAVAFVVVAGSLGLATATVSAQSEMPEDMEMEDTPTEAPPADADADADMGDDADADADADMGDDADDMDAGSEMSDGNVPTPDDAPSDDRECPSSDAEAYSDVDEDSFAYDDSRCLRELGISEAGDTYRPGDDMTRSEMAAFMANAYAALTEMEAPVADHMFTDVEGDPNEDDIARISPNGLEITKGASDTAYDPGGTVVRGHMALFLTRLYAKVTGSDAPAGDTEFTDVGDLSVEEQAAIGSLFALGVTTGTSDTMYSPRRNVTREQMASFVARMYRAIAAPLGAPGGVSVAVNADDSTVLDVSWTAPEEAGSGVAGYVVQWKSGDEEYSADREASVDDGTSWTSPGLSGGVEYVFRVAAVSSLEAAGRGAWSGDGSATVPAAPGAPTEVTVAVSGTAGNALAVSWTAPEETGSSDVTGYVVQWKSGDDEYSEENQDSVDDGTSWTSPATLTKGTTYTFRVAAVNTTGTSEWSADAENAPGTEPGSVRDFAVVTGNVSGTLNLSWKAPTDDGGTPITGYQVQYVSGRVAPTTQNIDDGAATSHTITGLTVGSAYRVSIRAVNGAGMGPVTAPANTHRSVVIPSTSLSTDAVTVTLPGATDPMGVRDGGRFESVTWRSPSLAPAEKLVVIDTYDIQRKCGKKVWPTTHAAAIAANRGHTQPDANVVVQILGNDVLLGGASTANPGSLENGVECTFRVRAKTYVDITASGNSAGTQDTAGTDGATVTEPTLVGAWVTGSGTPLGAPGTPSTSGAGASTVNAIVVDPANRSLHVSWSTPMIGASPNVKVNDGGSPITGYKVSWYSPETQLVSSQTVAATANSYTIPGLVNNIPYHVGVEAINARGSSTQTTPLVQGTPGLLPGAPTNVRVAQPDAPTMGADDQRGNVLVVSWTAPAAQTGVPAVTGYQIQRRTSAITMPATAAAPAGRWSSPVAATSPYNYPIDRTASPTELGVSYDFQIRAMNANGNGPWSDFASGTAADLPEAVLGANIEVIAASRSLVVTWNPAVDNGADIIDYSVRWAVNRTGNELWSSTTVAASALPITVLSGLTNGEPYVIGITASNSVGSSRETQTTTNPSPAGAVAGPSTVTAVANPTAANTDGDMIDVTWSAVPNVAAYRVEYLDVTSNPTSGWTEVAPTGTSISTTVPIEGTSTNSPTGTQPYFNAAAPRSATITVTEGMTYVVRVRPVTQPLVGGQRSGDGIEGTPGFSAPVKAEATPATAVTHTDRSAALDPTQPAKTTTVRVTWAPDTNTPAAEAAGITGYMVTWYPTLSTVAGNRGNATVAADARSFDITGLTAIGEEITVVVSPVNKIGVGDPATGTHTLTPATT